VSDDIVIQLRNECQCSDDCRAANDPCISMRAADEIEELRARVERVVSFLRSDPNTRRKLDTDQNTDTNRRRNESS